MAWSISITAEGWADIRRELETWDRQRIIDALADDEYERVEEARRYSMGRDDIPEGAEESEAAALRERLADLPEDVLVDAAMDAIERNNTCDNGGFRYWIDREGYHGVTLN